MSDCSGTWFVHINQSNPHKYCGEWHLKVLSNDTGGGVRVVSVDRPIIC
jgi:hypothetical protein